MTTKEKKLLLYVDQGGDSKVPFPSSEDPIEIGAFRYDAKRMGGAPIITASVNYPSCLDDEWTDKVYAEFRDEKYYLKQTPTSSYDNEDSLYKHDIELVSERAILDNVYFFDAVVGNPQGEDKPVSNSTKVVFFGGIKEFARRMNASLEYSKLLKWEDGVDEEGNPIKVANGYNIVVDNDEAITTEEKLMSFEDQFFSNVLQEIYNVFQVPYYFVGKTIHIGFASNLENPPTFAYGVDDALLSITKNNANFKVVNRVTGTGSSDNIPFYYPNQAPKGDIELHTTGSLAPEDIKIEDVVKFNSLNINKTYTFHGDISLNTISSEVVVPSSSVIVPFDKNKATIERLYFGNDGVDVNIRYNLFLDSYANGEIEINWSLIDIPNISFNVDSKAATNASKQLELEIRNISLFNNDNDEELPFELITEKLTYYSVLHYVPNSAPTGILDSKLRQVGVRFSLPSIKDSATILVSARLKTLGNFWDFVSNYRDYLWDDGPCSGIAFTSKVVTHTTGGWRDEDNNFYNMRNYGISFLKEPQYNDTFKYTIIKYINTSEKLMPSVYRHSDGKERFYNAIKYPYPKYEGFDDTLINGYYGEDGILRNPYGEYEIEGYIHNDAYKGEDGDYVDFKNLFVEGHPKEHIIAVEDIKPTIKDVKVLQPEGSTFAGFTLNSDMFTEFAYDRNDNDETEEGENEGSRDFKHSYFFGKLRVLDFNLFDHAIENQPMTISFTSGDCGACNFTIGVTEEFPQKNPVQVDDDGNLIYDEKTGNVVCTDVTRFQERQQDTSKYEVWIALKKEEETYGILMPKAPKFDEDGEQIEAPHRPKACTINEDGTPNNDGDTFVILGINLPKSYIINAEKKLEEEIIKYLKENNEEKFTFSIGFSRIYFEEHPSMLQYLNENSRFYVTYNNKNYLLYVTSYSYQMSEGDILPQITVELDENLTVSQNALQNAINEVRSEVGAALSNIDVLAIASPFFIRKDIDDVVNGTPNFVKGLKFGEGGKVEVMDNNSAKLTIEYLEVTKKASFTSLEIKEKTHVGGQLLVTPAAINCGEVEELEDSYRCYFQTIGEEGEEIFNQFAVGDFAVCQTYNTWGSRYYWREVVEVGDYYIDLSQTLCDEGSDAPIAGDKIIQLGNKQDKERQNAIVIAAYGEDTPSIIQYKGINGFEITDKNVVTKLSSTENIFTGKVHMELGSDGAEYLDFDLGGQNLLRNSGFTGDYLSERLADDSVLDENKEMFSNPFAHWKVAEETSWLELAEVSQSGFGVALVESDISQDLPYKLIPNETYVLSFKGRGTSLCYRIGDAVGEIALSDSWEYYTVKVSSSVLSNVFALNSIYAELCDLQLERGSIASAWGVSYLDNSSDRAYWQSMKYLQDAMDGASEFYGGLALTETLQVGNYNKETKSWDKITGGINGVVTNNGDDVAFWAGGNFDQAIDTLSKYNEDPQFKPTEEQLATMAHFIVSHGGKAILNEAIVRGSIYANEGNFGEGCTIGDTVRVVKGGIEIDTHVEGQEANSFTNGKINLSEDHGFTSISNVYDAHLGGDGCSNVGFAIGPHDTLNFCPTNKTTMLISAEQDDMAINVWCGSVGGLRTRSVYIEDYLDPIKDYGREVSNILFPSTGSYEINLDDFMAYQDINVRKHVSGQELWLETMGADIKVTSSVKMWIHFGGEYKYTHDILSRGVVRLKYYGPFEGEPDGIWTLSWVESISSSTI